MFVFTTHHVVVEVPECTPDCPELKTFKTFSHKKTHCNTNTKQKDERLIWLSGFAAFMVNRCVVHWFQRDLWVETAQSNATCFALWKKTKLKKTACSKTRQNGHELNPIYTEKATTNPSIRKWNLFLYLCLDYYVLTAILNFSYKVFTSFTTCKTIPKIAVIYAPNLGPCALICFTKHEKRRRSLKMKNKILKKG